MEELLRLTAERAIDGSVARIISERKKVVNDSHYAAMWNRLSTNFA